MGERKPGDIYFSPELALQRIERLGYVDISTVPTGRGNDYLTTLKRIAEGEFQGIDFCTAYHIVREQNNVEENTPGRF